MAEKIMSRGLEDPRMIHPEPESLTPEPDTSTPPIEEPTPEPDLSLTREEPARVDAGPRMVDPRHEIIGPDL